MHTHTLTHTHTLALQQATRTHTHNAYTHHIHTQCRHTQHAHAPPAAASAAHLERSEANSTDTHCQQSRQVMSTHCNTLRHTATRRGSTDTRFLKISSVVISYGSLKDVQGSFKLT